MAEVTSRTPTVVNDRGSRRDSTGSPSPEDFGPEERREAREEGYPEQTSKGGHDPYQVRFEHDDPDNPKNWKSSTRWGLTFSAGLLVLNATFASSAPSGIAQALIEEFHFSREVATLAISLFVAAYCVGPILWGPLSEQFGRRPIFLITFFCYTCFQVGCALSPNTASILVFRFLGGLFAAAPLTNSGALLADIWDAKRRGKAMAIFTIMPFAGVTVGPTVGGFIFVSGTSWRWLFWVLVIYAGLSWFQIYFFMPETYEPVLLVKKAEKLRKQTGDDRYYAPFERNKRGWRARLEAILARPFKVLFQEPMLIAITTYMSFVYGVLYLSFESYPIVFSQGHHFNAGISGLMFLPIPIGGIIGVIIYLNYYSPKYSRAVDYYAPHPVPPEERLPMATLGGICFTVSLFWFGWTSYPSISYWAPLISGVLLGLGIQLIFLALFNYIIDAYLFVAASALASNTVVRSCFGAGFPLFATQMYETLNPRWASTLLGCLAALLMPIPYLLIKFGPKLREKSKYAPTLPAPSKDEKKTQEV